MANERLRGALVGANLTVGGLSEIVGVDPKTVERWITKDRVPHRVHRMAVASAVGKDDGFLWPTAVSEAQRGETSREELVGIHPSRGAIPMALWSGLLAQAQRQIDILAFAATFLHDAVPDFDATLAQRAADGVQVRLCLGDPASDAVRLRGLEEGIGSSLADRCTLTWKYFRPFLDEPNIAARMHEQTLYASMFRFDDDLLVNTHVLGAAAGSSPVLQLHHLPGGRVFTHYVDGFERTWDSGRTVEAADIT